MGKKWRDRKGTGQERTQVERTARGGGRSVKYFGVETRKQGASLNLQRLRTQGKKKRVLGGDKALNKDLEGGGHLFAEKKSPQKNRVRLVLLGHPTLGLVAKKMKGTFKGEGGTTEIKGEWRRVKIYLSSRGRTD